MSLARATGPDGRRMVLNGEPPFPAQDLIDWIDVEFDLPCDDPWVLGTGDPAHGYLDGARNGWSEYPEWMDFLDVESPCYDLKRAERDLYLHHWKAFLGAKRVLDVGCGIGRFVQPFLDRGADVWGVDPDIESLRRCVWHAAGRLGRLDLSLSSAHVLPDAGDFDVAVACEVLCYVPDAAGALAGIVERLRPGGALLFSVEGRWGWAVSQDAPAEALDEAIDGAGVIDLPGDRWVRTYEAQDVRDLIESAGLDLSHLVASHYVTDGPLERCAPEPLDLAGLLAADERCRRHPVWGPLNRAWTGIAVR